VSAAVHATLGAIALAHETHGPALAAEQAADLTSGTPLLGSPARWRYPIADDAGRLEPCLWRAERRWCQCFRCPGALLWAREIVAGRGLPAGIAGTPAGAEAVAQAATVGKAPANTTRKPRAKAGAA
jgi:hypothetical protein